MAKSKDITSKSDLVFEQKKQETWSQRTEKNGITESITVEKLANQGYLVILSKYGIRDGKYMDHTRKLYSETNPLDKDETNNPITEMFNTLSNTKK
jgi:hypothetical protein